MTGGYYDPETPGHHAVDRDEFVKVFGGGLVAAMGCWNYYVGCDQTRATMDRVVSEVQRFLKEFKAQPSELSGRYDYLDLREQCFRTLFSYCLSWAPVLGGPTLLAEIDVRLHDESVWEQAQLLADAAVAYLIEIDEQASEREKASN